ncbi:MAG: hypothetical protein K2N05_01540 [Muribaculaceae bacterium]|nr:hypothetical protein [Muribaculaceae bacterium]
MDQALSFAMQEEKLYSIPMVTITSAKLFPLAAVPQFPGKSLRLAVVPQFPEKERREAVSAGGCAAIPGKSLCLRLCRNSKRISLLKE